MNIAVDSFPLTVKIPSGIPNYLKNILLNLIQIDKKNRYFLYCRNPFNFLQENNLSFRFSSHATESSTSYGNTIWLFTKGVWMMKKDKIDIFWGTRHMLPLFLPKRTKKVLTVHDLVWHYFPRTMENYNLVVMKILADRSIKASDHIIAPSHATARSIMDIFNVPTNKVSVIYHGADQYIPHDKNDSAEYISRKYGTNSEYVLTVSTIEPRKNLGMLLEVFAMLRHKGIQLVVAGATGWKTSPIFTAYERLGLSKNEVKFFGYVPDEDINMLYSGARLFLFPSIYEGFGLPPLEAMASGTPVVASRSSSLPEVVGDAGVLLEPHDIDEWVKTITNILSDRFLQDEMIRKGLERAKKFSWKTSAEHTLEVFKKLFE